MKKTKLFLVLPALLLVLAVACNTLPQKEPVDYVDPYIGNISHLLVPTYPTVGLPNGMMRVYPNRGDYTSSLLNGFPLLVSNHRGGGRINLKPYNGEGDYTRFQYKQYYYDFEKITPYRYSVYLDEENISVDFAPAAKAAMYTFDFESGTKSQLLLSVRQGSEVQVNEKTISGFEKLTNQVSLFFYGETDKTPIETKKVNDHSAGMTFDANDKQVAFRYGVSYISVEQAKKNMEQGVPDYDMEKLVANGRAEWNNALGKIKVDGGTEDDKTVFYTSLYRTYERMIHLSEDGKYYSAFDNQVHDDEGIPFYTDDWIWDTYRAVHPLHILINPEQESHKVNSFIRMYEHSGWFPTFPEVTGDAHCMNGNHYVATIWDAYCKGLRGFDLAKAYEGCKKTMAEETMLPWRRANANALDAFYNEKGYLPALHPGEPETYPEVNPGEKRQTVAVTLAASYDDWCMAQIAKELGKAEEYNHFLKRSYNYRNLFNPQTGFFHPKDKDGNFIEPFDYIFSGGQGARDYYDENNGWVYRWDVPHNVADLVQLIGGKEKFVAELDRMFVTPLGKSKYEFYAQLPDHTGNVGQFSMANEPCIHIPYLYNYAGAPWKTQKRIRSLIDQWFRPDVMGSPGDEDGGGMTSFVVFSMMGFYPVTPGSPTYNIGSPFFENITVNVGNGKTFTIEAKNCSAENKYIQSAKLNGQDWNKPWFNHTDIVNGGKLELVMGNRPNKNWGIESVPPSAEPLP